MFPGIRHTAVLSSLAFVLIALVVACGGTQPLPDIDATVEARIQEKQAEDAALEARAQTMAKAMVEATAQAVQNRSMGGFSRLHAGHFMERIPYTIPHQPASGTV